MNTMTSREIMDVSFAMPTVRAKAAGPSLKDVVRRTDASAVQSTGRRIFGGAVAIGVQVVFIGALAYGTMHGFKPKAENLTVVGVVEEMQVMEELDAPPPPRMDTPVIQVEMPLVTITEPPAAPNAPTAVAAQTPPPPLPAISRVHGEGEDPVASFQKALLRHLHRHLRYPPGARAKREQGVVYVRFAMDRDGRVLRKSIERSSRFLPLDDEAMALLERAQPLPTPPMELGAVPPEMVVPVAFSLRNR
jgi:TonB family protein